MRKREKKGGKRGSEGMGEMEGKRVNYVKREGEKRRKYGIERRSKRRKVEKREGGREVRKKKGGRGKERNGKKRGRWGIERRKEEKERVKKREKEDKRV